MQPIQRTFCPDQQRSAATYLAAMIDERTRDCGLSVARSATTSTGLGANMQRPDASVLIWVESGAELIREPVVGRHRGMLIVAHGSGHGHTERSFIISYPIGIDDHAQHLPAVSDVLKGMGWSILASRRGKVAGDEVNTAVLVNSSHSGPDHRLWLAEPVGMTQVRSASAHAPAPARSAWGREL